LIKQISLLSSIALALTGCSSEIDNGEVERRGGLVYKYGDTDPFTGIVVNVPYGFYGTQGLCTQPYEKGRLNGKTECFDGDKLVYEAELSAGKKNGAEIAYSPKTGNPVFVKNWANDRYDGVVEEYADDILISSKEYKNGIQHGDQKTWSHDGKNLLSDISWAEGKPVTGFMGDEFSKTDYVDGYVDGAIVFYREHNGAKYVSKEMHLTRSKWNGTWKSFDYPAKTESLEQIYEVEYSDGKPVSGWYRQFDKYNGNFVQKINLTAIANPDGADNDDPYPPDFAPDGRINVYSEAEEKVTGYEVWRNGERVEYDRGYGVTYIEEPQLTESTTPDPKQADTCQDEWINAYRKDVGEDALIVSEQLDEWNTWCSEGKRP